MTSVASSFCVFISALYICKFCFEKEVKKEANW